MIKLINGWTKEKVMEQVKKYNNGRRAMIGSTCTYLDNEKNRCAVGCFIPDNHKGLYCEAPVKYLLLQHPDLEELMPFDIIGLTFFQKAHDDIRNDYGNIVHETIQRFLDTEVE